MRGLCSTCANWPQGASGAQGRTKANVQPVLLERRGLNKLTGARTFSSVLDKNILSMTSLIHHKTTIWYLLVLETFRKKHRTSSLRTLRISQAGRERRCLERRICSEVHHMASVASGCSIKYQVRNVDKDATEGQEVPTGCSSYRSLIWLFLFSQRKKQACSWLKWRPPQPMRKN